MRGVTPWHNLQTARCGHRCDVAGKARYPTTPNLPQTRFVDIYSLRTAWKTLRHTNVIGNELNGYTDTHTSIETHRHTPHTSFERNHTDIQTYRHTEVTGNGTHLETHIHTDISRRGVVTACYPLRHVTLVTLSPTLTLRRSSLGTAHKQTNKHTRSQ